MEAAVLRHQPDVILLDIRLEGDVDGLSAVSRLAAATRPGLVVVSAYSDHETLDRTAAASPDAYLIKPYDERLLRTGVELAFQRYRNRIYKLACERAERRLEAQMTQQRELEARLLEAQRMEMVAKLGLGVAHDFNGLLAAIGCNAFLLSDLTRDERALAAAREIHDAVQRGGALTRMVMGYARDVAAAKKPVRVDKHLDELRGLLRLLAGRTVVLSIEASAQAVVETNPSRLEQIFMNLVSNAKDAIDDRGCVSVRASVAEVTSATSTRTGTLPPGDYVLIEVSDDGRGIPDSIAPRVFEPFVTGKLEGRGTGLGLSTVRDIALELGGRVDFETSPAGTVFRVWLPRHLGEPPSEPRQATPGPASRGATGAHVVLVEDDEGLASSLSEILRHAGYEVETFRSAEEALAGIESRAPRLLLADLSLPGVDGVALADRVTATTNTAVLLVSGVGAHAARGRYPILAKPFHVQDLLDRVSAAIRAG